MPHYRSTNKDRSLRSTSESDKSRSKKDKLEVDPMVNILERLHNHGLSGGKIDFERPSGLQITERIRIYLTIGCIGMNLVCLIVFCALFLLVLELKRNLIQFSSISTMDDNVERLLFFSSIYGSIVNLFTVIICMSILSPSSRFVIQDLLKIFTFLVLVLVIIIMISLLKLRNYLETISTFMKNDFTLAMQEYDIYPLKRKTVDRIQLNFECCGNMDGYSEWFSIPWINPRFIDDSIVDLRDELVQDIFVKNEKLMMVPFSCCSPASERPCINEYVRNNQHHKNYNWVKDLTLNKEACFHKVTRFFDTIFVILLVCYSFLFIFEATIFICARIVYLSLVSLPRHFPMATVIVSQLYYNTLDPHDLPPTKDELKKKQIGPIDENIAKVAQVFTNWDDSEGNEAKPLLKLNKKPMKKRRKVSFAEDLISFLREN